jgi:predicted AlkP superfamily pyrophosphatase or phosphodiesterase
MPVAKVRKTLVSNALQATWQQRFAYFWAGLRSFAWQGFVGLKEQMGIDTLYSKLFSKRHYNAFLTNVYKGISNLLTFGQKRLKVRQRALLSAFLCISIFTNSASAQIGQSAKPRLVILLIADQFPYDYLARFQDKLTSSGLKFLLESGADFTNCQFQQASNQTASGQAIIATGSYPWANGIVADQWYDRHRNKSVPAAAADDTSVLAGANGSASSSRQLNGTTISDQLKLATNGRSKVFAIALNDAPAVLMAGKLANGAFWWDTKTGSFVSSSQFGHELPIWAKSFNDQHYSERYFGKPWQRLMAEGQYVSSTRDDYPHERAFPGDGRQFPHVISGGAGSPNENFYTVFSATPWANQMVADFAKEVIEKENLGMHTDPDLISINFSATESVSNFFGPNSQESQDMVMRLDQTVAALIQFVDQRIGLANCLVVFTADHGVAPIPELLRERGFDSGRIDSLAFRTQLNSSLEARLGKGDWVEDFEPPNLYLNLNSIDREKFRQPDVEALAGKMAHSITGVGEVYTAAQFFLNEVPNGPLANTVRRSYYWGRSGELVILPKPGYVFSTLPDGSGTGSPFSYDAQVPLVLYGAGIKYGRYSETTSPADIAPTIASLLGIATPSLCEGRALSEALAQPYGPPKSRPAYSFAAESH